MDLSSIADADERKEIAAYIKILDRCWMKFAQDSAKKERDEKKTIGGRPRDKPKSVGRKGKG